MTQSEEPESKPLDPDMILVTKGGERLTVREFVQRSAERIRAAVRADYGGHLTDAECAKVIQDMADGKPPDGPALVS